MSKEAVFTLKLEADLRDAFMSEAEASHRPASQIVREFMREFVKRQKDARDYEAWLKVDVEQGLREADDAQTVWYSQQDIEADSRRQRDRILARQKERIKAEAKTGK